MIIIREEKREDIEGIEEVNRLAFKGENEGKLVASIRNSEGFVPELSLVAVDEQQIIGHILFSKISIITSENSVETIALAPMSVHPEYQYKGIGSTLVREGLKKCQEAGFQHVAVLGHPNFYPKFGFIPSIRKEIESPFPVPEDVFMVLELEENSLDGIKGKVKYPPSFDVAS